MNDQILSSAITHMTVSERNFKIISTLAFDRLTSEAYNCTVFYEVNSHQISNLLGFPLATLVHFLG